VFALRQAARSYTRDPAHGPLPMLFLLLTVVSGVVDATSLLRMGHVFVANMTGNIVIVGLSLAHAPGFSLLSSGIALGGFVVGAIAISAVPARWRADRARALRTAAIAKVSLALPVLVVGAALGIVPGRPVTYVLTGLLAASMGVQNATVQRLAVPDLTTTVMTTTLARLLGDLPSRGLRGPAATHRLASILALLVGATTGGLLVVYVNALTALTVGIVLLATVGFVAHLGARRAAAWIGYPSP
jgi:uncharacterized membrane protein YoaK (UPF0700 family)